MFEDIVLLNPSRISSTPRFWNKIYNEFQRVYAVAKKKYLDTVEAPDVIELEKIRKSVLKNFKPMLGTRITDISCGKDQEGQL